MAAGAAALAATSRAESAEAATDGNYLVGRGMADTTGPCAENGFMGYSMPQQIGNGISQRLYARAFVIVDQSTGKRIAWCVADQALVPVAAHSAIVAKLRARFPGVYDATNVCVTATHSHATPGGCSHDLIYNLAILGFQQQTFDAMVDGYVEAISQAHADLKPGTITFARTTLTTASANRSKVAFDLNPDADKAYYPGAIDPRMLVMRFKQGSTDVGAISWFPTHGTSLPNTNLLVSGDNKGYAAYSWERLDLGQDYLSASPKFVAAFAQTNTGDMTPNLALKPGTGPTNDPWQNLQIIGDRQKNAMKAAWSSAGDAVTGSIGSVATYIDMDSIQISGEFTPDGQPHRTAPAWIGASMLAGSVEDGPGLGNPEGSTGPLRSLWANIPASTPGVGDMAVQQPKLCTLPVGALDAAPHRALFQVLKIGQFYFACLPAEVTIVSGLRIRRAVAAALGVDLEQVLVQGYSNGYSEYVTTPEEYMSQQYEGGSTLYGRWTQCAYAQELSKLAGSLKSGTQVAPGSPAAPSALGFLNLVTGVVYDNPPWFKSFGDVVTQPATSYTTGSTASAVFVAGHPKNNLRRGGTYLEVQRLVGGTWTRVRDDSDLDTTFVWKRTNVINGESQVTLTWKIPAGTPTGSYRFVYNGANKRPVIGDIQQFTGASRTFQVQ